MRKLEGERRLLAYDEPASAVDGGGGLIMEITRRSKLMDVLKAYPFLEEQIDRQGARSLIGGLM